MLNGSLSILIAALYFILIYLHPFTISLATMILALVMKHRAGITPPKPEAQAIAEDCVAKGLHFHTDVEVNKIIRVLVGD